MSQFIEKSGNIEKDSESEGFMIHLTYSYSDVIKPPQPYNFNLTAMVYATPWDFDGKNAFIGAKLSGSHYLLSIITSAGSEVSFKLYVSKNDTELIEKGINYTIFAMALDEDLTAFYKLVNRDTFLRIINTKLNGIHLRTPINLWEGLLIGICQQNASFKQGWKMVMNLRKLIGTPLKIPDTERIYYTLPTPEDILNARQKLRKCSVGYREKTIVNAAAFFKSAINEDIESIKGVGSYSAAIARILGKRRYTEAPIDRWFARLLPRMYLGKDEKWTIKKAKEFAVNKWENWVGLALVMITIITGAKMINQAIAAIEQGKLDPLTENAVTPLNLWKIKME